MTWVSEILRATESPIEEMFVRTMLRASRSVSEDRTEVFGVSEARCRFGFWDGDSDQKLIVCLQARLNALPNRRVDVAIATPLCSLFIVELDGFKYHSDPAAFSSDRRKDRVALLQGIQTLRFAGVEVTTNCESVLSEVVAFGLCLDAEGYQRRFSEWNEAFALGQATAVQELSQ